MRMLDFLSKFQGRPLNVNLVSVMLARIANMGTGIVLIFVTSFLLNNEDQGYYYTFVSLAAAQFFFDLGVGHMLANLAGRQLEISTTGELNSNSSNPMLAIIRFACIWSLGSMLTMMIIISSLGLFIFSSDENFTGNNITIWLIFCALSTVSMAHNLFLRLFEGTGQVLLTSLTRLLQATVNVLLFGLFAYMGFGLAAAVIALAISLCAGIAVLLSSNQIRSSFRGLLIGKTKHLNWREEIWPFQRKMSITWLTGYLIFYSQVPILFRLEGAISAGQMGLCVQIFQSVNATANVFLTFAIKSWTALAVRSSFVALKKDLRLVTIRTTGFVAFLNIAILSGYILLDFLNVTLIERLPSFWFFSFYAIASTLNQPFFAITYYFRAQKKEPLWIVSLVAAIVIIIVPISFTGGYNMEVAIVTFLIVSSLVILPMSIIIYYIYK